MRMGGNDEQHVHLPHSLHFPSRQHDHHGSSKEEMHHHHDNSSTEELVHDFHKDVPKGCVAVYVGSEGEERQRFVIPAVHLNHPMFQKLLKEAEEEYGFEQKGAITIPCHVSDFQNAEDIINEEQLERQSHSSSFCFR